MKVLPLLLLIIVSCGRGSAPVEKKAAEAETEATATRVTVSEQVAKDVGLQISAVQMGTVPATVELTGEVAADPDRSAKVAVRVAGRIVDVQVKEGQRVAAGDTLAIIESGEVARVRADLSSTTARAQAARQRLDRVMKLVDAGTATSQDLESARAESSALDAEVAAARQTLASIGGGGGATARLALRAPIAGVVMKRDGIPGQPVTADHVLAEIIDLDHAYFLARLFEHDLARVHDGAQAQVVLDAYPGIVFPGTVQAIGRQVEPEARAVLARIVIDDQEARLKIGLFGTVVVVVPDPETMAAVPIVPTGAVTQVEEQSVVFVEVGPRELELRAVKTGHAHEGRIEILEGLKAGDKVATGGLFTLRSLALKSSFGEDD